MWRVSYRFANLLAAHLSLAPPDGWGIKLVLVNNFKIYAESLQGFFLPVGAERHMQWAL